MSGAATRLSDNLAAPGALEVRLAKALFAALHLNEEALVMGDVESRATLIDGDFDLLYIASVIVAEVGSADLQTL